MDNTQKLLLTVLGTAVALAAATTFLSTSSLSPDPAEAPVIVEESAPLPVTDFQPPSEPAIDDVDYQYGKFGEPMIDPRPTLEMERPGAANAQNGEIAPDNEGFLPQDDRNSVEDNNNINEN